jgi:hypothetical protein
VDKDFESSGFHQDTWNQYLMLGFVLAPSQWNVKSNFELRQSYKALRDDLVLLSTTPLSNICCREYALTMRAINRQLPSRTHVSLALDGWTSTNTFAITLVIAYYMDQKWTLREVQLVFDKADCLFFSHFASYLWMIGQGTTHWSKARCTFEGCEGSI